MLKIAITGNIASGKTLFERLPEKARDSVFYALILLPLFCMESSKPLQEFLLKNLILFHAMKFLIRFFQTLC